MREARFIKKNVDKWNEYQHQETNDPDEMADRFVTLLDDLLCRVDPTKNDEVLEKPGCRPMDFTGRPMKGWIFIDEHGMKNKKDFEYWIGLALEFNKKAKKSKKK